MPDFVIYEGTYVYFVTLTINQHVRLLDKPLYRDIVVYSLKYCIEHKNLRLHAYVVMPSHLHLIVFDSHFDNDRLRETFFRFKSFTAHALLKQLKKENPKLLNAKFVEKVRTDRAYRIWRSGYRPIGIINDEMLAQKLNYIHNNPVKAGLVTVAREWRYSSANTWENGEMGMLPIHDYLDVEE